MARPRLPIGAHGAIGTSHVGNRKWVANARYRGADGCRRQIERSGPSRAKAIANLQRALATMTDEARGGELSGSTRMAVIADNWIADLDREAALGALAKGTVRQYRAQLRNWVIKALGELQAREVSVAACDDLVKRVRDETSYDTAKSVRVVLTGVCGYAVRFGAMQSNPAKSISRLARGEQKEVKALSLEQRTELLTLLEQFAADKQTDSLGRSLGSRARIWLDLPDVVRVMLATGVRLGELLALTGDDVDPQRKTVTVDHHLVRESGTGLVRVPLRKGKNAGLTLRVPSWSVAMLRERKLASGGGALFAAWTGGWIDPSNMIHRIQEAFAEIGYGWVTSHVFRKTVASVLDQADRPLSEIADQLGNTQKVVDRHYRARRVANDASAEALESMFDSSEGA